MMNSYQQAVNYVGYDSRVVNSRGPDRHVLILLTLGMIAALITSLAFQAAFETQLKPDELYSGNIIKSPLYYAANALQIFFMALTCVFAAIALDFRTIHRTYPLRLLLLAGAAILMTIRGYTLADLHSTKLADATGPFPLLLSALVLVSVKRKNWRVLSKLLTTEAFLLSALVIQGLVRLQTFTRHEAVMKCGGFLNTLLWPAAWMALKEYRKGSWLGRFRFVPMLVYGLGSLFVQTRLNFIMILALLVIYGLLQRKRGRPQLAIWIVLGSVALWACLFLVIFARESRAGQVLEAVVSAFTSRLDEDTRTGQLLSFAQSVPTEDLILGRGSFGVWDWNGTIWNGGTDIGYLTLLFYGGLPLLLTYIWALIVPAFRIFSSELHKWQLPAAGVAALWSVQLLSSAYPGDHLDYYPILLCVGVCLYRDPPRSRRSLRPVNYLRAGSYARPVVH